MAAGGYLVLENDRGDPHEVSGEELGSLLYDVVREYGPYHPLGAEVRRTLDHLQRFDGRG